MSEGSSPRVGGMGIGDDVLADVGVAADIDIEGADTVDIEG